MKKSISLLMSLLLLAIVFTGCNSTKDISSSESVTQASSASATTEAATSSSESTSQMTQKSPMRIAALKGATAIGMVKLMEDYPVDIYVSPDEIVSKLSKGEIDIAAVPANLASVLYNKTQGKLSVAAINTLGVLYIVEVGDSIKTVQDLKGKTILSTGKGTIPEFTLNYILTSNGLDPQKDVTIEYKTESTEIAAALSSGLATVALLPEPFVTTAKMKNDKLNVALNMSEQWDKVGNNSSMITGVVVARNEFIENNKEAFNGFLDSYKASTQYVTKNAEEASKLVEKYDIVPASIAKAAIPNTNITFIEGDDMRQKLSGYLEVLLKQNPNSVGGKLPDENFYFKR